MAAFKTHSFILSLRGVTERLARYRTGQILRAACNRIDVEGVSTHSFRRIALTQMSGYSADLWAQQLRHSSALAEHYLEVTPEQKRNTIAVISF